MLFKPLFGTFISLFYYVLHFVAIHSYIQSHFLPLLESFDTSIIFFNVMLKNVVNTNIKAFRLTPSSVKYFCIRKLYYFITLWQTTYIQLMSFWRPRSNISAISLAWYIWYIYHMIHYSLKEKSFKHCTRRKFYNVT